MRLWSIRWYVIASMVTGVVLTGCALTEPRGPRAVVTTDAADYVAQRIGTSTRYTFTVVTRFENQGSVTLFLRPCTLDPAYPTPEFTVRLADQAAGTSGYTQYWALCVGIDTGFAVAPGAIRIDTLHVAGPNYGPSGAIMSGSFQIDFDVRLIPLDGADQAPASIRLSKVFTVHTAD